MNSQRLAKAIKITLTLFLVLPLTVQGNSSRQFGLSHAFDVGSLPYGKLREKLESLPAPAKDKAMKWLHGFSFTEQDIKHLRADDEGGIYYSDNFEAADTLLPGSPVDGQPDSDLTAENVFNLHSKPGSSNVVFLDFDGHSMAGTAWNGSANQSLLLARAYDLDGAPASFSPSELANIAEIWRRISEDFAAFDIDVTTEMPAAFNSTTGRILITTDTDENGNAMPAQGAGGVAYVGVWGLSNYSYYSPALVYYNRLGGGRPDYVSEAASHELGHNLSLAHDGTSSSGYYGGHGSGYISWGPLMGVGYGRNVSQWSKGEYPDANNQQDDIAIISSKLSARADDHPDTFQTQSRLKSDALGNVFATTPKDDFFNEVADNKGIISSASDLDVFYFDAAGGNLNLTITPAHQGRYTDGGNLDLFVELYDSAGNLVASNDLADDTVSLLNQTIASGRYYLSIQGVGSVNYSDYGSQGQYFISGSIPIASDDMAAPVPNPMAWASQPQANGRASASMQAVVASDASGIVEYQFQCVSGAQGCVSSSWQASTNYTATGLASGSTYSFQVVARDAFLNTTQPATAAQVTTDPNAAPVANDDLATVEAGSAIIVPVLNNDVDSDNDSLIVSAVTQGLFGTVSFTANSVTYHASGAAGTDSFTYTVQDGYGGSATAYVDVTITAVNQLPQAVDDVATLTTKGGSVTIDVLANDVDPDGNDANIRVISVSNGRKGRSTTNGSSITYQHTDTKKRKFNGSDTFTYTIEDEMGGQATGSVTVNFGSGGSGGGNGNGKGNGKNK